MRRHGRTRRLVVVGAVLALAAAATAAGGSGRTVSLAVAGNHTKALAKCGPEIHADLYATVRRGSPFELTGTVRPAPTKPGWRVRVVVKRCTGTQFRKVWTGMSAGRKGGTFRIAYTPRSAGLFIAVADYGKHPHAYSPKVRLHVV
jgi:hypothetical protein